MSIPCGCHHLKPFSQPFWFQALLTDVFCIFASLKPFLWWCWCGRLGWGQIFSGFTLFGSQVSFLVCNIMITQPASAAGLLATGNHACHAQQCWGLASGAAPSAMGQSPSAVASCCPGLFTAGCPPPYCIPLFRKSKRAFVLLWI